MSKYPGYDTEPFGVMAEYGTPSRADEFFRYHDEELTVVLDNGDQECPTGFFQLLEVTPESIVEYVTRMGDPWASVKSNLEPGWYILQHNSDGQIFGHYYGEYGYTLPEEKARSDFGKLEREYVEWLAVEEAVDEGTHLKYGRC